jgi:hypothetical protein
MMRYLPEFFLGIAAILGGALAYTLPPDWQMPSAWKRALLVVSALVFNFRAAVQGGHWKRDRRRHLGGLCEVHLRGGRGHLVLPFKT